MWLNTTIVDEATPRVAQSMLLLVKLYYTVHNYNLKCFAKCAVLGKILRVTHVHQQSPENLRGFFLLLIRLLYNNAYDDANSQ